MTETRTDPTIADRAPSEPATDRPAADRPETAAVDGGRGDDIRRDAEGASAPLSTADIAASDRTERQQERDPRSGNGAVHESRIPDPRGAPLFSDDAAAELRGRWADVQAGFVDEPRSSVESADALVAEVMKRLADSFATERQGLEQQWQTGEEASTEDLRVALRRYRSFFDRLLSV